MAEIWGAAIAVGGALGSAYLQNQAAGKANSAIAAGGRDAIMEQRREFDIARSDTAPYRQIGSGALALLGQPYGLSTGGTNQFAASGPNSEAFAGAMPANQFAPVKSSVMGGSLNVGGNLVASGKLGAIGKALDPAAAIFGSKHGDENRNLKAFGAESGVMELPDGRYGLPDGTIFNADQLKDVAGTWYGATKAPDGNQADWQNKWNSLRTSLGGGAQPASTGATIDMQQDGSGRWVPTPGGGVREQLQTGPSTGGANGPSAAGGTGTPDYSNFFASPDYNFRLQEGDKAITRNASALGGLASGNTGAALVQRSSDVAGGEYGNYFNRLASLAGLGQTAVGQSNAVGVNTANNVSQITQQNANARASGIADGANAWGNALGTVAGIGYNYFNKPKAIGSGGYGTQAVNYSPQYTNNFARAA